MNMESRFPENPEVDGEHPGESEFTSEQNNIVALGLIVDANSRDAFARALLKAQVAGYRPLVVFVEEIDEELVELVESANGKVLNRDENGVEFDGEQYRTVLEAAARTAGYQQLVVHDRIEDPIDYTKTDHTRKESDEFVIDAVTESTPETTPSVLAGIPAYNEAGSIGNVVEQTSQYVDEVVVIDDGSIDETIIEARNAGATVIAHETNRGYGGALQTAFNTAAHRGFDHLVVLDGDGQHEPSDIPSLIDEQRSTDSEIVIGSRLTEDGSTDIPLYRRFGLGVVNFLTNLTLGITDRSRWVKDTQSGFRAYDRTAIESLSGTDTIGEGMDASTDILYHGHKEELDIVEVGTTVYYDVEDGSSQHPVSHGFGLVRNLLHTIERDRPIAFVGVPGFLCALFGLVIGYVAMSNFLATQTFPLGLALASSVFFLTGLFLGTTAVVLHALKQYLENGHGSIRVTE